MTKIVDKIVYATTTKPTHYKEVKNPPKTAVEKLLRKQDARQVQYNNWSKVRKVYSGSYLPKDPKKLERKGWVNADNSVVHHQKPTNVSTFYRRKSTNQWVRIDEESKRVKAYGKQREDHYHWYNWWEEKMDNKKVKADKAHMYYDKYGETCAIGSEESHILGEDK